MTEPSDRTASENTPGDPLSPSDHETGLPGLRSWRTVYLVVFGVFLVWVGLLTWLTKFYPP
jgi:hypothetical protein